MIRLLALDVDDTLMRRGQVISERNQRAIRAARERGVRIVIATGRSYLGTTLVREILKPTDAMINYAGAIIMDPKTDSLLHATYLLPEEVRACVAAADAYHTHVQVYEGDTVIFRKKNVFTYHYLNILGLPFIEDPNFLERKLDTVPKVFLYADPNEVETLLPKIQARIPDTLSVLTSQPGFMEICRNDSTKGVSLEWVANYYGIPREEVAAIGDNTLDLSMIEWAGVGCCVANGNPEVQKKANRILPSCDEDGVAWFIEQEILKAERET